jgi:hypothetical protein
MSKEVYKKFEDDLLIDLNITKRNESQICIIKKQTYFGGMANIQKDTIVIRNMRQYPFQ